ncbi:hypothetical protein MLD52_09670 [Puniceicoccaceae bacterium K14]|nr:hypothetical protein [Puniceicoccaceae bacterium K14]
MITLVVIFSSILTTGFGVLALILDFRDKEGRVTKSSIIAIFGILLSAASNVSTGISKDLLADIEKRKSANDLAEYIYLQNNLLSGSDVGVELTIRGFGNQSDELNVFSDDWSIEILFSDGTILKSSKSNVSNEVGEFEDLGEIFGCHLVQKVLFTEFAGNWIKMKSLESWIDSSLELSLGFEDSILYDSNKGILAQWQMTDSFPPSEYRNIQERLGREKKQYDYRILSLKNQPDSDVTVAPDGVFWYKYEILPSEVNGVIRVNDFVAANFSGWIYQESEGMGLSNLDYGRQMERNNNSNTFGKIMVDTAEIKKMIPSQEAIDRSHYYASISITLVLQVSSFFMIIIVAHSFAWRVC